MPNLGPDSIQSSPLERRPPREGGQTGAGGWPAPASSGGSGVACAAIPPAPPSNVVRNRGTRCTPGGGCAPAPRLGRGVYQFGSTEQVDHFLDRPDMVGQAGCHCRSAVVRIRQAPVRSCEVVVREVESDGVHMVFELL